MLKRILSLLGSLLLSASVLATPAGDNILITEVEYDPATPAGHTSTEVENEAEWFELYNPTANIIDIGTWTIKEGNTPFYTFPSPTFIAPGEYLLVTNRADRFNFNYPGIAPDLQMQAGGAGLLKLNNGGDELTLKNGNIIIDYVAWENSATGWNAGAINGPICRANNIDTDTGSDWQACAATPGTGPGFTLSNSLSSIIEGNADTFTVVLDIQPTSNVVIDISSSDVGAVGVVPTTLTFTPANWNIPQPVNITGVEDDDDLFDEAVIITAAINAASSDDMFDNLIDQTVSVTVTDNDLAKISIDDVTHDEAHSGTTDYTFTMSIDYPSPDDVMVEYATADGSATLADNDYIEVLSTPVTIPAGQTSVEITLQSKGDTQVESDETFAVNLSNPTNAIIDDNQGDAVISNDDAAQISIADVTLNEGTGGTTSYNFTISINQPSDSDITVEYATADGSATTGDGDYTAISTTTATISAGSLSTIVTIQVAGDSNVESNEVFLVNLSNPLGATIADSSAVGTITNDDTATVSIDDVSQIELDAGNIAYVFTVSIDNPSDSDITFKYKTSDATATLADNDYIATALTDAVILAGNTSTTITVQAKGDVKVESDEQFIVELSNVVGAQLGDSVGVASIVDNDVAGYEISPVNTVVNEGEETTFSIVLTAQPISDVTFEIDSSDHGAASFTDGLNIVANVIFTPDNWNIPQLVSVSGVEDADVNDENVNLTASVFGPDSDPAFSGLASKAITVVVNDDDIDTDSDGIADEDDPDIDNDGNPNETDNNPLEPTTVDDFVETLGTDEIIINILENDDFIAGANLTIEQVGGTAVGGVSFNAITGEFSYTPVASEAGSTVTVNYRVCNTAVDPEVCGSATITMSIAALPVVPPSSIPTLSEWMLMLLSILLLLIGIKQGRLKNL